MPKNLDSADKDLIKLVAIMFNAQTIKHDGVEYRVPEKWKEKT